MKTPTIQQRPSLHLLISLAALVAALIFFESANAQDVYNFYFQKTGSAQEMVQVKNGAPTGPSASPTPAPNVSNSAASSDVMTGAGKVADAALTAPVEGETLNTSGTSPAIAAAPPSAQISAPLPSASTDSLPTQRSNSSSWQVNVGHGQIVDRVKVSTGVSLGGEWMPSKYFGFQGQLMSGKPKEYWNRNEPNQDLNTTTFSGALGAKITPIHLQLFGWNFIELSLLFGVLNGFKEPTQSDPTQIAAIPYVGGGVALNITDRVSVLAQVKFEEVNTDYGHMLTNLAYRF